MQGASPLHAAVADADHEELEAMFGEVTSALRAGTVSFWPSS